MMLPIRLRREALEELSEAWQWYETKREGLGDEFRVCIDAALAEISRSPLTCGRRPGAEEVTVVDQEARAAPR